MSMRTPWSDEVVAKLNKLQSGELYGHPYTCPNSGDGNHLNNGNDIGCLVAGEDGWTCLSCEYTQDWAHDPESLQTPEKALGFLKMIGK